METKFTLQSSKIAENKAEVLYQVQAKELNNSSGVKSNWNSDINTVRVQMLNQNGVNFSKWKTISRNMNNSINKFSSGGSISNSSERKMIKLIKIGTHSSSDSQKNTISNFGTHDKWTAQSMLSPLPLKVRDASVNLHYKNQASVLRCKFNLHYFK